jgi:hypothetical protein
MVPVNQSPMYSAWVTLADNVAIPRHGNVVTLSEYPIPALKSNGINQLPPPGRTVV